MLFSIRNANDLNRKTTGRNRESLCRNQSMIQRLGKAVSQNRKGHLSNRKASFQTWETSFQTRKMVAQGEKISPWVKLTGKKLPLWLGRVGQYGRSTRGRQCNAAQSELWANVHSQRDCNHPAQRCRIAATLGKTWQIKRPVQRVTRFCLYRRRGS